MKYLLIILSVLMLSCNKQTIKPNEPQKKTLTVSFVGNAYLDKFTVNQTNTISPATVYSGDKIYIRIVTRDLASTINYKIYIDGVILYSGMNTNGYTSNFVIN